MLRNTPARVQLVRSQPTSEVIIANVSWSWAFRRQAEAFVQDVRAGWEPLANARDSVKDLALAEAIWRKALV
jgi:predicted dehydrogenase